MFALLFSIFGVALLAGDFTKIEILHIAAIYLIIAALMVSYVRYFIIKRGKLSLSNTDKTLLIFVFYGIIIAVLSYTGISSFFSGSLKVEQSYVPRQAYYLFVLPAIILFKDEFYTAKFDRIIKKYGETIFWVILLYIMIKWQSIIIPTQIILCWLSLEIDKRKKNMTLSIIRNAILIFSPLPFDGTSTVLLVRMLFLAFFLFGKTRKKDLVKIAYLCVMLMLVICFILPFIFPDGEGLSSDYNVIWRLGCWNDELTASINSGLIGVGYGTAYATQHYIDQSIQRSNGGGPYAADSSYTSEEKAFVTASHNSFITVAFRLGIIGITTLLLFINGIYKGIKSSIKTVSLASCFVFYAAIILIAYNVGLESPHYMLIFIFALGKCVQEIKAGKREAVTSMPGRSLHII